MKGKESQAVEAISFTNSLTNKGLSVLEMGNRPGVDTAFYNERCC